MILITKRGKNPSSRCSIVITQIDEAALGPLRHVLSFKMRLVVPSNWEEEVAPSPAAQLKSTLYVRRA